MSGLFVLARKASDMEFATTRGRHIKTISEVRRQTKKHNYQRKKVKHMNKLRKSPSQASLPSQTEERG